MRVVVLGGAGDMGSEAVRDLNARRKVSKVIIADANRKKAEKLCEELGAKLSFQSIDALNHDEVVRAMKLGTTALSCLGPFYKFEEKMVRAAVEARVNYVSICDDFDAAEATLAMDKEIKKSGIIVLSGMGWTPGMSNVLARKGIASMDKAERVNIYWAGSADDSEGVAVIKHTLHIFNDRVPTFTDGKWKKVAAGSGREDIEFPAPIGVLPMYHLGHPEPITIPHFHKHLQEVTLKGGVAPPWLNRLARGLGRFKITDTSDKRDNMAGIIHFLTPVMSGGGKGVSGIRVDVHGTKGGEPASITFTAVDKMRRLTGIPAAIGAIMLGSGEIQGKGFLAPEICVDPDAFIKELSKRDVKVVISKSS
jgi:saccharopine dehydrogenase-like NADP-dependent oxidoreductase